MKRSERLSAKDRRLLKETLKELNRQGRLQEEKLAKQHGSTSVYQHSINVAYLSLWLAGRLPLRTDRRALVRGALLHDYFLYDWHHHRHPKGLKNLHGFRHPQTALKNAEKEYVLTPRQRDIIGKHMWPLTMTPPACREAWIVTVADKYCSLLETLRLRRGAGKARRHGARRGKGTEGRR